MNLVFLGLPGTGKGTQAELIARRLDILHIATGDIFRQAISEKTELGRRAKAYLDAGELVPDEVTCGMVQERLSREDTQQGFILDGFPRTIVQAEALARMLKEQERHLDGVIYFTATEGVLIRRLAGRRVCPECGSSYHIEYNPPAQAGVCDRCGGKLIQRSDDQKETIRNRLQVNRNRTDELRDYYRKQGKLFEVNAEEGVDPVTDSIMNVIARLK